MTDRHSFDRDRRTYPAEAADRLAIGCPEYRDDAVAPGPFAIEPFDLRPVLCLRSDGEWRHGHEIEVCATAWLVGALRTHGVDLGHHDHLMTALIAHDGWSTVQVVAGWIARAAAHGRANPSTDSPQGCTDGLPGL